MTPPEKATPSDPVPRRATFRTGVHLVLTVSLFSYLQFIRTRGVTEHFVLLGDQIRDWTVALGPFSAIPLVGPPMVGGGYSFGPVFYWVLWGIRAVLGPWFDNLPHAGGIGLAALKSAADLVLLYGLWKRIGSLSLALAVVLLISSAPYDLALSSVIWNPNLSVTLIKLTFGLFFFLSAQRSPLAICVTSGAAWLAVQAHSTALFAAASVLCWFIYRELAERRYKAAALAASVIVGTVLVLQLPYLVHVMFYQQEVGTLIPVPISVAQALRNPDLHLGQSYTAMSGALDLLLWLPGHASQKLGPILAVCAALIFVRTRKDPALLFVTVVPLAFTLGGFAAWQSDFTQYWYLETVPSVVFTIALGITAALPGRSAATAISAVLLVIAIVLQPFRYQNSTTMFRVAEYGPLARASRYLARNNPEIRAIRADFLPPSSDPHFLFRILGGRLSPTSNLVAVIRPTGTIAYRHVGPE